MKYVSLLLAISLIGWTLAVKPSLIFAHPSIARKKGQKRMNSINPVYPGKTWATKTPAEVGLDAAKLGVFRDAVGGRGCVVRYGYMSYTWGDISKRADIASACKPWFSHFLFKALEDGKISSLDEKMAKWEPRLNTLNSQLNHKDQNITWRHAANQISCYGITEPPGAAFDYNDWQMALLWDTLFLKVYGATCENVDGKVLHPLLTAPLQCEDNPTLMAFGTKDRPGRTAVSVRDFARFGLLYLRKGNWKFVSGDGIHPPETETFISGDGIHPPETETAEQLISREHAAMAVTNPLANSVPRTVGLEAEMIPGQRTLGSRDIPDNQCDHLGSYSWLWWTNGIDREGKRHWPDAPVDTYGAFGHGGPRAMIVIPSLDLVVSWNDANIHSRDKENQTLKLLVEAVVLSP